MSKSDLLIAVGLGAIVGALFVWNMTVGVFVWGFTYVGLGILFGAAEPRTT